MSIIRLENITKRWGGVTAVNNITLDIRDKEFMVLLGPSGCGKTTTMRMIAGLEEITSGNIYIGDILVNQLPPKDRDVAMVFQGYGLYPHMTVEENIGYPLKLRRIPRAERRKLIDQAAARVELDAFLTRKPSALSGGQRQRVALARAIVRTPNCFLMDEPLSNLDARLRVLMRTELKHLQHELQITTVFVTHDQVEAMTLADRVAVINEGEICQLGTPEDIYNEPISLFVAGFIGSPAMNLVQGSLSGSDFQAEGVSIPLPRFIRDQLRQSRLVLGIRAEDIRITSLAEALFKHRVYSVEKLGDATLITIRIGRNYITAKVAKEISVGIGEEVGMTFAMGKLYFFDAATQESIPIRNRK